MAFPTSRLSADSFPAKPPLVRRWPAYLVATLAGGTLGVAGFTFDYAEGLSYLSDDPRACVNCHVMQEHYDAWQHASHHAHATCNDCHVPHDSLLRMYLVKAEHGYHHSRGFTFNDFHEPIRITPGSRGIITENCARCHADFAADIAVHGGKGREGSGGSGGVRDADCLHCHTRVGHGPLR